MLNLKPGSVARPLSSEAQEKLRQMDAALRAKALAGSRRLAQERRRAEALVLELRLQRH
jgi:hypothetical protein